LARGLEALKTKGIKLNASKGIPPFQTKPNNPQLSLRNVEGKIDKGVLENG
jgi:hypothetical protein